MASKGAGTSIIIVAIAAAAAIVILLVAEGPPGATAALICRRCVQTLGRLRRTATVGRGVLLAPPAVAFETGQALGLANPTLRSWC